MKIISLDAEELFNKTQSSFLIKTLKLEIGENILNLIKNIYEKPTVNIILNGEKLEAFPLRPG